MRTHAREISFSIQRFSLISDNSFSLLPLNIQTMVKALGSAVFWVPASLFAFPWQPLSQFRNHSFSSVDAKSFQLVTLFPPFISIFTLPIIFIKIFESQMFAKAQSWFCYLSPDPNPTYIWWLVLEHLVYAL